MELGTVPLPGRLTNLIKVGLGPIAIGAGAGCFRHFFSHLSLLSPFSLCLKDGQI